MTDVNEAGRAYARTLIAAGKIDRTSSWDFSAADGDALLGASGSDWTTYSKAHLGVDAGVANKTKGHWAFPFAKGGKIYARALDAIRSAAMRKGDGAIAAAAAELLDRIPGKTKGADMDTAVAVKGAVFEFQFKEDNGASPGQFEGYGSVFNNEDDGGDMMLPGAFDRTLAQHRAGGTMPKMLLNHGGMGGFFGSPSPEDLLPVGKWNDLSPDQHGLAGKGQLINLDTESGKKLYGAMKEGQLSDMSIMYVPRDFTRGTKPNEPRRSLKSVDLLEMGPVTFPMNRLATINTVKSALAGLAPQDMRDLETALRDGGLSRSDAVKACAVFKTLLQRDAGDPDPAPRDAATSDDFRRLADRIRAATGA